MSQETDAVIERIANRLTVDLFTASTAPLGGWTDVAVRGHVAAVLNEISKVLESAQEAVRPSVLSISREVQDDYHARRKLLREALAALVKK